jgi:hypothetical protein
MTMPRDNWQYQGIDLPALHFDKSGRLIWAAVSVGNGGFPFGWPDAIAQRISSGWPTLVPVRQPLPSVVFTAGSALAPASET